MDDLCVLMLVVPQEKATKWKNPDGHMDGLTTNGVLVMHPEGFPEDPKQGLWREISVCGDVYALRETRSGPSRGKLVSHRWFGFVFDPKVVRFIFVCVCLCVNPPRQRERAVHYETVPWSTCVVPPCCGVQARGSCVLPPCATWRHFARSLMHPGPSVL